MTGPRLVENRRTSAALSASCVRTGIPGLPPSPGKATTQVAASTRLSAFPKRGMFHVEQFCISAAPLPWQSLFDVTFVTATTPPERLLLGRFKSGSAAVHHLHPAAGGNMNSSTRNFDLVVIGSGPAGQKGALTAAAFGKSVAIVERKWSGRSSDHAGTISSRLLREAVTSLASSPKGNGNGVPPLHEIRTSRPHSIRGHPSS